MTTTSAKLLIDGFGRVQEGVHGVLDGLAPDELTWRGEDGGANSIGWLVWHLARVQDCQVADAAGLPEVWHAQGWQKDFALPYPADANGYGASSTEVGAFSAPAGKLTGYYDAVHEQTVGYLRTLHEKDYARIVDDAWDPPVTLGVRLVSILDDDLQHVGQAAFVQGALTRR